MLNTDQIRHAIDNGCAINAGFLDLKNSVIESGWKEDRQSVHTARASFFAGVMWMLRLMSVCPEAGIAPRTLWDRLMVEIKVSFPELPTTKN
jgi:hypothetical protein